MADDAPYMNPFWFVPIDGPPAGRFSLAEWGIYDERTRCTPGDRVVERDGTKTAQQRLYSGRIVLRLKTITPLHVTGEIKARPEAAMTHRSFYRRLDALGKTRPAVEGSSLRGMLRAYVEALTNGVISSYLVGHEGGDARRPDEGRYAKKFKKRHIGFWIGPRPSIARDLSAEEQKLSAAYESTFTVPDGSLRHHHGDRSQVHLCDAPGPDTGARGAVDPREPSVWPPRKLGDRVGSDLLPRTGIPVSVDAATLLFGLSVPESDEADRRRKDPMAPRPVSAIGSRVSIDDAFFDESKDLTTLQTLDLNSKSSLGAPNPSKSTWWYFKRGEIRGRMTKIGAGVRQTVEFVGADELRGRKFYFHQDPVACLDWYRANWKHFPMVDVPTECVKAGAESAPLTIHFQQLPLSLVRLLLVAISPSCRVRHKLGALRPFGFGSVALEVQDVQLLRRGAASLNLSGEEEIFISNEALTNYARNGASIDASDADRKRELALRGPRDAYLVEELAWNRLRLIGYCPTDVKPSPGRLFVYPPFRGGGGLKALEKGFAYPVQPQDVTGSGDLKAAIRDPAAQEKVIARLWKDKKRAIDIDYYQKNARNYQDVQREAGSNG